MTKSENAKKFSIIAAICYMNYAIYIIISWIIPNHGAFTALNIIPWIATLGVAVTLFTKNKNAVVVAVGINALLGVYNIISYLGLHELCGFIAYASAVMLIVLSIKGNSVVKKIWFIPACVMLLGYLVNWLRAWMVLRYLASLSIVWKEMVFSFIEIVAMFFVGMWIKEDATPAETAPVNEYATFNSQAVYSSSAASSPIGGADKLKTYKDLLDSGAITQEEFDIKKKEIFGV